MRFKCGALGPSAGDSCSSGAQGQGLGEAKMRVRGRQRSPRATVWVQQPVPVNLGWKAWCRQVSPLWVVAWGGPGSAVGLVARQELRTAKLPARGRAVKSSRPACDPGDVKEVSVSGLFLDPLYLLISIYQTRCFLMKKRFQCSELGSWGIGVPLLSLPWQGR